MEAHIDNSAQKEVEFFNCKGLPGASSRGSILGLVALSIAISVDNDQLSYPQGPIK